MDQTKEVDPVKELQKFNTFRRGQIRWLERFVSRLTAKRDARIDAARAKLSAPALRLLVAMDGSEPEALDPNPIGEGAVSAMAEVVGALSDLAGEHRGPTCYDDGCWTRVAAPGDYCAEHAAHDGPPDEPEPTEPDEPEPADCRPPVEQWTEADFKRNGWVKMPDGNYAPPRLAAEPEPLAPGSITTVEERPAKRQREARRA